MSKLSTRDIKSGPMVLSVQPVVVPAPPAPIRHDAPQPPADAGAAPLVAPAGVAPEREPLGVFENSLPDIGVLGDIDAKEIEAFVPPPPPPPAPAAREPIRIGGAIRQPSKFHDVTPVYPSAAMMAHLDGIVIIEATIGPDGRVQDARVLRTPPLLGQAALDAVRQWVYTPTLLNGVPVPVIMTVTVRFVYQ